MTGRMKNVTLTPQRLPEHVETMEDYKEELEASFTDSRGRYPDRNRHRCLKAPSP